MAKKTTSTGGKVSLVKVGSSSAKQPKSKSSSGGGGGKISSKDKILKVVADSYCKGTNLIKVEKLVAVTKLAKGSLMNVLTKLKKENLLESPEPGAVSLTEAGVEYMGDDCKILTPEEVQAKMKETLKGKPLRLFELLKDGLTLSKEAVAKELDFPEGKKQRSFMNFLSKLKTGGMIEYPDKDHVKMTDVWLGK